MALFPHWSNLKHFPNVSTTTFGDGQVFYDILKKLSKVYDKNPNFPKQHAVDHVIAEIRTKGTTDNYRTGVGKGFQQESSQTYDQTNRKNAEDQMAQIDEKQEAIAKIRMAIDNNAAACAKIDAEAEISYDDFEEDGSMDLGQSIWAALDTLNGHSPHWKFGSPGKPTNSRTLETKMSSLDDSSFKEFDERLRDFISLCIPDEALHYEDLILTWLYKCAHIKYQSLEDWTESHDILFTPHTKWKPNTIWDGCQVLEEDKLSSFLLMETVVRGALLAPAFGSEKLPLHYFMDTIDGDMYLRARN
ncbi:hypothetical protein H0H81_000906 [Sphagnurus paluster]|uniref:Uncharacterized protein n=1 Tax=Sphagnurus paluster TaxID=117069 RepID=A0A9P7GN80_9AGAR|nr:hypothetical protein H0H81_000906 [Sphagnurus paluster]